MPRSIASRGRSNTHGSPSSSIVPPSERDGARDDLRQRRLAGAVLAGERDDLAGADREVDPGERRHRAVALDDGSRAQHRLPERRAIASTPARLPEATPVPRGRFSRDMSSPSGGWYGRAHELLRRGLRRVRHQFARGGGAAVASGVERVRAGAERHRGWVHPHVDRPDAAGVHARGARLVAPPLHRLRRLRRAEGRARPSRCRVHQHRPAHGQRLPRRLGRVRVDVAGGQRRRSRPNRSRGRRGLGAAVQRLHGQRRPRVRTARHRALVCRRAVAGAQGVPAPGASWPARVRGRNSLDLP